MKAKLSLGIPNLRHPRHQHLAMARQTGSTLRDFDICEDGGAQYYKECREYEEHTKILKKMVERFKTVDSELREKPPRRKPATTRLAKRITAISMDLDTNRNLLDTVPYQALRLAMGDGINDTTLEKVLEEWELDAGIADDIRNNFCRIMGILVNMRAPDIGLITRFIEEGVSDRKLPVMPAREVGDNGTTIDGVWVGTDDPKTFFSIPGEWDLGDWNNFVNHQWRFITPLLVRKASSPVIHYKLSCSFSQLGIVQHPDPASPPPQSGMLEIQPNVGANARVHKVKFHPLNCWFEEFKVSQRPICQERGFDDSCLTQRLHKYQHKDGWLALKALNPGTTRDTFETEVVAWNLVNSRDAAGRTHATPLLCTLELNTDKTEYYLLMPWANGNLVALWQKYPEPGFTAGFTPEWVTFQCWKLAETLSVLHNVADKKIGTTQDDATDATQDIRVLRHGDIKPENILWFSQHTESQHTECYDDRGVLVFSDFGISKVHRLITMSLSNGPTAKRTGTYAAPEFYVVDMQDSDKPKHLLGRSADIWALGCTWIELITWHLKGHSVVDGFGEVRVEPFDTSGRFSADFFFKLEQNKTSAKVKEAVCDLIRELAGLTYCDERIKAVLALIESKMLVVSPRERATAMYISEKLKEIYKCKDPSLLKTLVSSMSSNHG